MCTATQRSNNIQPADIPAPSPSPSRALLNWAHLTSRLLNPAAKKRSLRRVNIRAVQGGVMGLSSKDDYDVVAVAVNCTDVEKLPESMPDAERLLLHSSCPDGTFSRRPTRGSAGIARQKEWSQPGSASLIEREGCKLALLHTQWLAGPPVKRVRVQPGPSCDRSGDRLVWLRDALDELASTFEDKPTRIAVPWMLGCADKTSDWKLYLRVIEQFTERNPTITVDVVRDPHSTYQGLRANFERELKHASDRARRYLRKGDKLLAQPIGELLIQAVEQQIRSATLGDVNVEGEFEKRTVSSFAAIVKEELYAQRGHEERELENEAINERYRQHLRDSVRKGTITERDVTEAFTVATREDSSTTDAPRTTTPYFKICPNPRTVDAALARPEAATKLPSSQVERPTARVSSAYGSYTPARLGGVDLYARDGLLHRMDIDILDGGSGTTLVGDAEVKRQNKQHPDTFQIIREPKPTSIERIRGIGALNMVLYWVGFTLNLGGVDVEFEDVPVLNAHRGLLLGNDFLAACNSNIQYLRRCDDTGCRDGTITICDSEGVAISEKVPFFCTPPASSSHREAGCNLAAEESPQVHVNFTTRVGSDGKVCTSLKLGPSQLSANTERLIEGVQPMAYAPKAVEVPSWSQKRFWVRAPAIALEGHEVAVVPIEDSSYSDLGVLIAPSLQTPKDGWILIQAINLSSRPFNIAQLTPVARIHVNPRTGGKDIEFNVDEILEGINVNPAFNQSERAQCRRMLAKRRRLFASQLGYAHGHRVHISTKRIDSGEVHPPAAPMRWKRTAEENEALVAAVKKQLKQQLIEPASSPFNATPMCIPKASGGYRVVLDFRALNAVTDKDTYPLPSIEGNLAKLGKSNWFSTADLLMGFHQCELDDISKPKTAFSTPLGQMQYRRLPMGLTSSPGAFMRLVDSALRGLPPGICLAYVDDIIIHTSGTLDDHLSDVGKVFDKLIEAGFTVRQDKVYLAMSVVPYLGFLVGQQGTLPQPEKTRAILDMAFSHMRHDPQAAGRFSGMMGFYHKFIENLGTLLAPFNALRVKGAAVHKIMDSLQLRSAFEACKYALSNVVALARPDFTKPFYITVDSANSLGTGACLSQLVDISDATLERPLAFHSRRFLEGERRRGSRDQELMGLIEALREWRHYIVGSEVIVRTDHRSLMWLLSTAHADGSRAAEWALKAQEFQLKINYVPGNDPIIKVVDCLSRHPAEQPPDLQSSPSLLEQLQSRPPIEERVDAASMAVQYIQPPNAMRVALACFREGPQGWEVLLESQAGHCSVPDVTADGVPLTDTDRPSYRAQLALNLLRRFPDPVSSGMIPLVQKAHPWRPRFSTCGTRFFCVEASDDLVLTDALEFVPITVALQRLRADDRAALRSFVPERHLRRASRANAGIVVLEDSDATAPTVETRPEGPAFCRTSEDIRAAVKRLWDRLHANPGLCLTVDLEGELGGHHCHISLMQVSVGSFKGEPHLTYVLDTHANGQVVFERVADGLPSMRGLLEDASIPKFLHSCYGDLWSMFMRYDVHTRCLLDSAIADCLIQARNHNRPRGLLQCIHEYLGDDVTLKHKGQLDFERHMFEARPLTLRLFEYAYEDVIFGHSLYIAMLRCVDQLGIRELAFALSQERAPQVKLFADVPLRRRAIAVTDGTLCVCLQDRRSGELSIPSGLPSRVELEGVVKQQASSIWARVMGPPGRHVRAAVNSRLRKAVPLNGTFLCQGKVRDCTLLRDDLTAALEAGSANDTFEVALVTMETDAGFMKTVREADRPLMQYLWYEATQQERSAVSAKSPVGPLSRRSATAASAKAVKKKEVVTTHASVIVHDDSRVYVIHGLPDLHAALDGTSAKRAANTTKQKTSPMTFPFYPLSAGEPAVEAAARAFDTYAGASLRKRGTAPNSSRYCWMNQVNKEVASAFENLQPLGAYGNAEYFSCHLPSLAQHATSFYSARYAGASGFHLLSSLRERYPDWALSSADEASTHLGTPDSKALATLVERFPSLASPTPGYSREAPRSKSKWSLVWRAAAEALLGRPLSKCPDAPCRRQSQDNGTKQTDAVVALSDVVSKHLVSDRDNTECSVTDTASNDSDSGDSIDSEVHPVERPMGADPAFDALHEAAVLVLFSQATSGRSATCASLRAFRGNDADGAGGNPRYLPLTVAEIIKCQQEHPMSARFIEYLTGVDVEVDTDLEDTSSTWFKTELKQLYVSSKGVLMRHGTRGGRIVVPPSLVDRVICLYHDRGGHLGVHKVYPLLAQRFFWVSERAMKARIAAYINHCRICVRAKVARGGTVGAMHVGWNGDHAYDCVCVDHFSMGVTSAPSAEAYDGVLDFACCLTRHITCSPTKGTPDSREIAHILLREIIRVYGTPSEMRSDRGSNLVSAAIQALYAAYGIEMKDGTAYNHHAVGLLERWHHTLKQLVMCQRIAEKGDDWHTYLPLLELCFNAATNATTGYSPFFAVHLRHARLPQASLLEALSEEALEETRLPDWVQSRLAQLNVVIDAVNKTLHVTTLHNKKKWDLKHNPHVSFQSGQQVLLYKGSIMDKKAVHPKASPPTEGPFTILRRLPRDRYVLTDLGSRRIHNVVHVSRVRLWPDRRTYVGSDRYPISAIVAKRRIVQKDADIDGSQHSLRTEYKVRWTGFPRGSDSWRDVRFLHNAQQLIDAFEDANNLTPAATEVPRVPRIQDVVAVPPPSPPRTHGYFSSKVQSAPEPVSIAPPVDLSIDYSYLEHPVGQVPPLRVKFSCCGPSQVLVQITFLPLSLPSTDLQLADRMFSSTIHSSPGTAARDADATQTSPRPETSPLPLVVPPPVVSEPPRPVDEREERRQRRAARLAAAHMVITDDPEYIQVSRSEQRRLRIVAAHFGCCCHRHNSFNESP